MLAFLDRLASCIGKTPREPSAVNKRMLGGIVLATCLGVACRELPTTSVVVRTAHVATVPAAARGALSLPNARLSVKFAVIVDSGRGTPEQHAVADQMVRYRDTFNYNFVLMLGDNIYEGPASPEDYRVKFESPYRTLLQNNVRFFAVLGNHDDPRQVDYVPFNMQGERYYTFVPPEDPLTRLSARVEFFALDSTNLDTTQLRWLDERLGRSRASWKIVFLHHPLYTSGRYRNTSRAHRLALDPVLKKRGVNVVFSGHEHIYQRSELQDGIQYVVSGGAGSLREGDGDAAPFIARSYSSDYHFVLIEIDGDALHFQAITRGGETIDAGVLRQDAPDEARTEPNGAIQRGTPVPP